MRRSRTSRVLAAGGVVAVVVATAVACQPTDGELNTVTVATTTDQLVTEELNRTHADVAWLDCTATYSGTSTSAGGTSPSEVKVDCHGETRDGKEITVQGWVYGVVPDRCVRGTTIARVDNKVWFKYQVLGNCAATTTPEPTYDEPQNPASPEPPQESWHEPTYEPSDEPSHEPTYEPSDEPTYDEPQPGTTETVTETVTVPEPEPTCSCSEGNEGGTK
ncbi:hypothetical protein OKJ48_30340 [Streptomyces kunmingensis]|uniref:Lipoprotein n=1 Tax=Streptomyces kunmingensis TaxID=68225 RepID=A0ABU6CIN5_9ACTN|nr:hypothetical protein [Streptomyces kunmingensis]MEB3964497.1 hypothetical protein [Streptomyces kunmingensis]